jgi:hypothetical protein
MLVKSIETLPALAVREVVLYLSWPSGLAATLRALPPALSPVAGGGGAGVAADVEAAVVVGVELAVLALFEELPHPARSSSPVARAGTRAFEVGGFVRRELTGRILHRLGVVHQDPAADRSFPLAPFPLPCALRNRRHHHQRSLARGQL